MIDNEQQVKASYPKQYSKSIGYDDSQRPARGANANRNTLNIFGGKRDWIMGLLLGAVIILGLMLFFEYRHKAVAADLASYNASEARIQQEVNKQLLVILNCKRAEQ